MINQEKKRIPPKIIKVLIVDDHPMFREGLIAALKLSDEIKVIGYCEDGECAIRAIRKSEPDIVLLDVNLPKVNGLQVARQIKAERLPVHVIIISAYAETEQIIHAFRAGAMAYCNKEIEADMLINSIHDVMRGIRVVDDKRMTERELDTWINEQIQSMTGTYVVDPEEHYLPLSPRETEILQFVTNGLSNKEIAHELGISQQTVKNHMTSILNKLNVKDRTQAAVTALKHGWVRQR